MTKITIEIDGAEVKVNQEGTVAKSVEAVMVNAGPAAMAFAVNDVQADSEAISAGAPSPALRAGERI